MRVTVVMSCAVLILATISAWWMLGLVRDSVDFADEEQYFSIIPNPWMYSWGTSNYCFVYYSPHQEAKLSS